jgi:hypothetical protein
MKSLEMGYEGKFPILNIDVLKKKWNEKCTLVKCNPFEYWQITIWSIKIKSNKNPMHQYFISDKMAYLIIKKLKLKV